MAATDKLLTTVLRAYQTVHDPEQTSRILGSTTSLLTSLSNPLNVTLLTSQLLIAPAIWSRPDGTRTCLRVISVFNTAAITVRQHQVDMTQSGQLAQGGGIPCDDWARAVVKGADEKSPRWRHVLVIGGVLLGMEGQQRQGLFHGLRTTLEEAMVAAINMALAEPAGDNILAHGAIVLALSHTFDLLSDRVKRGLNYDVLGPIIIHSITGPEGYQEGYFLGAANVDIRQDPGNKFDWSPKSTSFLQLQKLSSRPLVSAMGPLSRVAAHSLSHMADARQLHMVLDHMRTFTEMLAKQWRYNKLSEIDPSDEQLFLNPETLRITFPILWQVLKAIMFAIANILRAIVARTLVDPILIADTSARSIAVRTLRILRDIHFISSRLGSNAFSAYTFVFLSSIDILSRFPYESQLFLTQIRPMHPGEIPPHPLDRNLDLFFLNTSEHFTLLLHPPIAESLIVAAASPYLFPSTAHAHSALRPIFESAHSALLAVLSAPQNAPSLAPSLLPFYTESLFSSFPKNLSPRQFRFAFKTLVKITTPPAPLAAREPLLPDTLLELLRHRAIRAPTSPLPPALAFEGPVGVTADTHENSVQSAAPPLSEQAVLTLTLLDALPFLPLPSLEEWLPLAAEVVNTIHEQEMRDVCVGRFWEVMEGGRMDVERAGFCVAWWGTRGGREMVLFGNDMRGKNGAGGDGAYMSGGLAIREGGSRL